MKAARLNRLLIVWLHLYDSQKGKKKNCGSKTAQWLPGAQAGEKGGGVGKNDHTKENWRDLGVEVLDL